VQPAEPLDEWKSPPFVDKDAYAVKGEEAQAAKKNWTEPAERNDNIYARGAVDDKGQLWMQMKAYESLFKAERRQAAHQCSRALRGRRRSRRREHRGVRQGQRQSREN
jgi:acetylornithine deacetylase/succinyl-diaminopimelate desuccinylase-like protein